MQILNVPLRTAILAYDNGGVDKLQLYVFNNLKTIQLISFETMHDEWNKNINLQRKRILSVQFVQFKL